MGKKNSINQQIHISWLFIGIKVGQIKHYPKIVKINGEYCYLSATLTQKRGEKPELLIIISYNKNEQSFLNYRERWQIECCFKAMKSSGFDIENTHLQDLERIEKLLCLVMIAFVWCYKVGDYIDKNVKAIKIKTRTQSKIGSEIWFRIHIERLTKPLQKELPADFKNFCHVV